MPNVFDIHLEIVDIWNCRDWESLRHILHPDCRYSGPATTELIGPQECISLGRMYANAFPDGKLHIRNIYVFANTSVAELRATGTHLGDLLGMAPTGRRIELDICNVIDVRDGKVYREREYLDMMELMTQLGLFRLPFERASTAC
jgi:steroid delta-isomerase-like uncharacterized protein